MKTVTIGICLLFLSIVLPTFAAEKPIIRFGVIPRYNPLVMYKRYQPIMDYLTAETPYRFELKISKDYPEAVRFLQQGVTIAVCVNLKLRAPGRCNIKLFSGV